MSHKAPSSSRDGDVAAGRVVKSSADASGTFTTGSGDGSPENGNVTAGGTEGSSTDASTQITADGGKRAISIDGEGVFLSLTLTFGGLDARIIFTHVSLIVLPSEDERGIAQAGDTCPEGIAAANAINGHTVERHCGTVSNRNLYVGTQCARQDVTVLGNIVGCQCINEDGGAHSLHRHRALTGLADG